MRKCKLVPVLLCFLIAGCFGTTKNAVVLMPDEMIYTVAAGTMVNVQLDKKPKTMTFGHDMKLVSSTSLVKYEAWQNDNLFSKIKVTKKQAGTTSIISSILGLLWWFLRRKKK